MRWLTILLSSMIIGLHYLSDIFSNRDLPTLKPVRKSNHHQQSTLKLRSATNQDFDSIYEIIAAAYIKFGDRVWLDGYDSDLLDIEKYYSAIGGAFVVLENKGQLIGMHAVHPVDRNTGLVTFRRLYVRPEYHGREAGKILFQWAIDWAHANDFKRVEFWSDTRFARAHNFFEKFGFAKTGKIQHMKDAPDPYSEYQFFLNLDSGE